MGEKIAAKNALLISEVFKRLGENTVRDFLVQRFIFGKYMRIDGYDFICLNLRTRQEFIWEHFGMMNDAEYASSAYPNQAFINCFVIIILP